MTGWVTARVKQRWGWSVIGWVTASEDDDDDDNEHQQKTWKPSEGRGMATAARGTTTSYAKCDPQIV